MKINKNVISLFLCVSFIFLILSYTEVSATKNNNALSETKQQIINQFKKVSQSGISTSSVRQRQYSSEKIIVKFPSGLSKTEIDKFENQFGLKNDEKLSNLGIYSYDLPARTVMSENTLLDFNYSSLIQYAEPDYIYTTCAEPYYTSLWGLKNNSSPGIDINVESAWARTKGNSNVIVAVIDTGIDYNHPEFRNRIVSGWDFANNDNDPRDDEQHGTHVSGTIAASENNIGVIGVAPNVKIMPLKVFDSNGYVKSSDIILAIEYAQKHGASIVNMSLAGVGKPFGLEEVMKNSRDMLFVCAAGNGTNNNGVRKNNDSNPSYPASYKLSNNIAVAAINSNGSLASFSNYGVNSVDIAAPGVDIYSTIPNDRYAEMGGTSMATPHVAGVAALVKSVNSSYSPSQIKNKILSTSKKLSNLNGIVQTGAIVNAGEAVGGTVIIPDLPRVPDPPRIPDPWEPRPVNERPHLSVKASSRYIKLYSNSGIFDKKRALNQLAEAWDREDGGSRQRPLTLKNDVKVKMTNPSGRPITSINPRNASFGLYKVEFSLTDRITKTTVTDYLFVAPFGRMTATKNQLKSAEINEIKLTQQEINELNAEPAPEFMPEPAPEFMPEPAPEFMPEPAPEFMPEPAPIVEEISYP